MECRRGFTRTNQKRDLSLSVRNSSVKTNLHRSASSQILYTTGKPFSFWDNFRFIGFDKNLLENSLFTEFLSTVYCPFCLKLQRDKTVLIKHLNESCLMKMKRRFKLYAIFQILPSNAIKCNVCPDTFLTTVEDYFFHLHDDDHVSKRSEIIQAGKEFTDLLHCARCKTFVPNTYIQLLSHIQNRIHESRKKNFFKSEYSLRRNQNVCCIYNADKQFKCLLCPFYFLFNKFQEIVAHFATKNHMRCVKKSNLLSGVYCCFCDEEISTFQIQDHFTSDEHTKNSNSPYIIGNYDVCLYCGFACSTSKDLFTHMKFNCEEVHKIRQEKGWRQYENSKKNKMTEKDEINNLILEKDRHILVKRNTDVSKILKVLKRFGEITHIMKYDSEYLVIEFGNVTAIESLLLVQDFIKIRKKLDIKFIGASSRE